MTTAASGRRRAPARRRRTLPTEPRYVLRLYTAGLTLRSARAIRNVTTICQAHLDGRYDLVVVDLHQQPQCAGEQQIVAVPTLIRTSPLPVRRVVGDLSDVRTVLAALDLDPAGS